MQHIIKTTPELREGDIVGHHGMRLLIDREIKPSRSHPGTSTFWTDALVLNRDEVTSSAVPFGWTLQPDGTHRWNIQGNELARWSVEKRTTYIVIENTPGYLPEDDDPATFEDLDAAQAYMRERVEQYVEHVTEGEDVEPDVTLDERSAYVTSNVREHDLGRVFEIVEEEG